MDDKAQVEIREGYCCGCGKWNWFSRWVYANWYETIKHVCRCGRTNVLKQGWVVGHD